MPWKRGFEIPGLASRPGISIAPDGSEDIACRYTWIASREPSGRSRGRIRPIRQRQLFRSFSSRASVSAALCATRVRLAFGFAISERLILAWRSLQGTEFHSSAVRRSNQTRGWGPLVRPPSLHGAIKKGMALVLDRPLLLYDGECRFCRNCVHKWRAVTEPHVDYAPSQERGAEFPHIDPLLYDQSVVFIEVNGHVRTGADAVLAALTTTRFGRFARRVYRWVPGASSFAEHAYRWVAENREAGAHWFKWLCPARPGQEPE